MANVATKTKKPVNTEVGIIGQMYEHRKSKRVGVLESREEKYKTLMLRDKDGKSFNITYSTFRSDWRKYNGEEVVQTSTQVKEERTEEKKREAKSEKIVKEKSEVVKVSREDRRKRVIALEERVSSILSNRGLNLKVERTARGGVIARYKKHTVFEVWDAYKLDKYSFRMKEDVAQFIKTDVEKELVEGHIQNIRFRVPYAEFETMYNQVIDAAEQYIQSKETTKETTEEKKEEEE